MDTTNQNTKNPELSDTFLDDAAVEALGAHSPEESDAFIQRLAKADAAARKEARQLKETVARFAAASPYMEPPASLRGKILEATAPKQFKLEDYRKRGEMAPVWQRWGLVAAVLFLTLSTGYTEWIQTKLKDANAQVAELAVANHRLATIEKNYAEVQGVVTAMVENNALKIPVVNDKNELVGVLLQNKATKQVALVMPKTLVPEGMEAHVTVNKDGQALTLVAVPIGKSSDVSIAQSVAKGTNELDPTTPIHITTQKDGVTQVYAAGAH